MAQTSAEYKRNWRASNPERARAINRRWYEKHKCVISDVAKRWRKDNPELSAHKERRNHLRKTYGLSMEEYAALFAKQDGKCSICLRAPKTRRLAVDHNHVTGKIRGLLCTRCNRAIALLWENQEVLQRAITYLR